MTQRSFRRSTCRTRSVMKSQPSEIQRSSEWLVYGPRHSFLEAAGRQPSPISEVRAPGDSVTASPPSTGIVSQAAVDQQTSTPTVTEPKLQPVSLAFKRG